MVCKERGSVFEVVFCKSLEDSQARGWTQAAVREARTTFPLQGQIGACCSHVYNTELSVLFVYLKQYVPSDI